MNIAFVVGHLEHNPVFQFIYSLNGQHSYCKLLYTIFKETKIEFLKLNLQ